MSDLSENKRRLLEQRLGRRPSARPAAPDPIPPRPTGPPPLSPGQTALLYEYRLHPDDAIYNVVFRYDLRGPLDAERFQSAVEAVVDRHEPLHTSAGADRRALATSDALRVQHVSVDEQAFDELADREARRRVDVDNGPLVRVTVAMLDVDRHGVIIALHHVSSDAASFANLWAEIDHAYHDEPLPDLKTSYSAHAEWHVDRVSPSNRQFWKAHLGRDAAAVELPLERPVPIENDGYLTVPTAISAAALHDLRARPTPFFLGVFAALLQRYTDTDDVVVGVTASTRDHPDVEPLVGYFLTLLPLRLPIDPESTSTATARSVDEILGTALGHRHVPYSTIASDRRQDGTAQPDPARVMFVYDEPHQPTFRSADVEGRIVHPGVSVTDLTLFVRPKAGGFEISIEWRGSQYRSIDIEHFASEFVRMAEWAVRHPGSPWSALPHEPDLEGPPLEAELRPIIELIETGVAHRPEAVAVRCGTQELTYQALWDRSAVVAQNLRERNVQRGQRVAVVLPRRVETVAVILGIQRLAAAYVPIDPSYPPGRIELILDAANVDVIVTDATTQPLVGRSSLLVDELDSAPGRLEPIDLDDPAYVIFTSGSTGMPRGVPVDHRRLAASTSARMQWYQDPVEAFLLPSSLGFDSSVAGLYWTLATGGVLVIPTEAEVHDVDALGTLVSQAQVTHTLMVPSLYRALLTRDPSALRSLRCAIVAGEACPSTLVDLHNAHLPGTSLINEYGPTEATVWATAHRCRVGDAPVPIGRPIPGTRVRVVDRWLRPRPSGASGQLAIGGGGVTDGYLDHPEHTADTFVSARPDGRRFYLSGDLVRIDDAEQLRFLGRIDHQISVGGTRIEPEEIEAALLAVPDIRAAVVRVEKQLDGDPLEAIGALDPQKAAEILQAASGADDPTSELAAQLAEHATGASLLVAYIEGNDLDEDKVRQHLAHSLPANVVPAVIEIVDRLERTDHGKVDRGALPPPLRRPVLQISEPDGGDLSTNIVQAFRSVLNRSEIDDETDFFEAGGDSLQAVEVVTRLEDELGRRIPISALVLGRTPRQLAALIGGPAVATAAGNASRTSHVVPLKSGGEPPLLVMPPGGGNLIAFDPLVQALPDGLPLLGFDLPGADRDEDLPASVEDLVNTYLPQLRAAAPTGPYRFLGWSFGGVVALELAQRLTAEGEDVELVAMIDTLVPGYQRAGRLRIYQELAKARDVRSIVDLIGLRIRNRIRLRSTEKRGQRAGESGSALSPIDRDLWLTIKIDEIVERHRARPYEGRVVFFSAQDTFTWRTTEPWGELLSNLEIVALEGSHDGEDGLLSGDRVLRIASELAQRLG